MSFLNIKYAPRPDRFDFELKADYSLCEDNVAFALLDDSSRPTLPYAKYFSQDEVSTFVSERCGNEPE